MKVNFRVKMKVNIEFLVEIYFKNDLHFFEKYFTWGNIQPSRDFLDTLYNNWVADGTHFLWLIEAILVLNLPRYRTLLLLYSN